MIVGGIRRRQPHAARRSVEARVSDSLPHGRPELVEARHFTRRAPCDVALVPNVLCGRLRCGRKAPAELPAA